MKQNEIVAIIVTFNRIELLKENIDALKLVRGNFDILVIDNHSTDDTEEYLKNNGIDNIRMDKNVGGAGGFSFGIKEAVNRGYKYIWLMDDDTIPSQDSLNNLLEAADKVNDRFGFLCSYVEWIDSNPCIMNIPTIAFYESRKDIEYAKQGIIKCTVASFVSMLIKADTVKQIGLPIKEFFIWGDDVEFSNRLSNYEESYFIPNSIVTHKMKDNNSTDITTDVKERINRYRLLYRNKTYMARKKGHKERVINNLSILYHILKIIKSNANSKGYRICAVVGGWIDGYRFNPKIEKP